MLKNSQRQAILLEKFEMLANAFRKTLWDTLNTNYDKKLTSIAKSFEK